MNKYHAKKTEVDGIVFDSRKEANRYSELRLTEKAGVITKLKLQPKFVCMVNDKKICTYRADFKYLENGKLVVEDTKGFRTPVYRLKKKLVEALFNIEIVET